MAASWLQDKMKINWLIIMDTAKLSTTPLMPQSRNNVIAVCQMTATSDKEKNFEVCKRLVTEAKNANAKIAFLPEACDYVGTSKKETFSLAEPLEGPLVTNYQNLAQDLRIWLSLGGIHETSSDDKLCNTHILINDEGKLVGKYCKAHLFDVEIPEQNIRLMESEYIQSGNSIPIPVSSPVGNIGMSICYDMRFPELSLVLRKLGADILTFPSAFTFATGASHWEPLLRARAIESQCYVVAAAQTGAHNPKRTSWGHAMVVDPWGKVIAQCSEGAGIAIANIDLDYIAKVRKNLPVQNHRRIDLYPTMLPKKKSTCVATKEPNFYHFGPVKISRESVFYTSNLTIAFTNKRCVVPGHVLIAPIRSAQRMADLNPEEVADLFQVTQKIAQVMEKIQGASSSTIVVQDGPEAGQTIQHVHVHILPRKPGDFDRNDDIYDELQKHDRDENKPWRQEEEMCAEAEDIRNALKDLRFS